MSHAPRVTTLIIHHMKSSREFGNNPLPNNDKFTVPRLLRTRVRSALSSGVMRIWLYIPHTEQATTDLTPTRQWLSCMRG
eukprot:7409618-Pyramimonas_sp.AAC.2